MLGFQWFGKTAVDRFTRYVPGISLPSIAVGTIQELNSSRPNFNADCISRSLTTLAASLDH
jgi:hypothetical protein